MDTARPHSSPDSPLMPGSTGELPRDRILIVEDERLIAVDIKDSLESMGYSVVDIVSTGDEAIAAAGTQHPDLVLMDIMIEGRMDGIETAAIIMERFALPVLFITSYSTMDLIQRLKKLGASGYILKPFNYRELEANIALAIRTDKYHRRLEQSESALRTVNAELVSEVEAHRATMSDLKATDARLSTYLSTCPDGIVITNLEGVIDFATDNGARLFHAASPEELAGRAIGALLDPGRTGVLDEHVQSMFTMPSVEPLLCAGRAVDGADLDVEVGSAVIRDEAGVANALFFLIRDMANWKKVEKERHQTAEETRRQLQFQLEGKMSELASQTVFLLQVNEFHRSLMQDLLELKGRATNDAVRSGLQIVINKIGTHLDRRVWDEFRKRFENIHPAFYRNLHEHCPDLSLSELKLCALSRLNLSTKEIAELTYKSSNSVKVARSRLRSKLGISSEKEFYAFLLQL